MLLPLFRLEWRIVFFYRRIGKSKQLIIIIYLWTEVVRFRGPTPSIYSMDRGRHDIWINYLRASIAAKLFGLNTQGLPCFCFDISIRFFAAFDLLQRWSVVESLMINPWVAIYNVYDKKTISGNISPLPHT